MRKKHYKKFNTGYYVLILFIILIAFFVSCSSKYLNSKYSAEERAEDLLKNMTLEEKIGQMTQVDRSFLQNSEDIKTFYLGSILSGGNSGPKNNTPEEWFKINEEYQNQALKTRLKIPFLFGVDLVHGNAQVGGSVIFPHNIGLGCIQNFETIEKAGRITAIEARGSGINWTFSPCLAVVQDERWGRTYESFSEDHDLVSAMGSAIIKGYQGTDLRNQDSILACAKHYAGDGGTCDGKDQGDTQCDETTLRDIYLKPYIDAIKSGVGSVMVSFSSWNGVKLHANKYLITDVLKDELGFKGFVVTDWGGFKQVSTDFKDQVKISVNAGIDMFMIPDIYKEFIVTLKQLIKDKEVSMDRIDDAVKRILRVKFMMGLFENPNNDKNLTAKIGSKEHREIARQCVRESTVLLKNDNKILPLSKDIKNILVTGKNADNLGYQCGGWTLSWQGLDGNITQGTTILQAIKNSVSSTTEVNYSINGKGNKNADVCIVVIGETPYAEFQGDSNDLHLSIADKNVLNTVKKLGKPTIVVLITGRPLIITKELNKWNGLVVAWLPGTEGQGVADVLFGDYKPTAKLSFTWPKEMSQIPINAGDSKYDPLFPFGFGLTY